MRDKKHLVQHSNKLAQKAKGKDYFLELNVNQLKQVPMAQLNYTIKKGVNKNKIADEKNTKK